MMLLSTSLLLLLSMLVSSQAWRLASNGDEVTLGETRDVQLACEEEDGLQNKVVKPTRIRITKLSPFGNKYTFASVDDVATGTVFKVDQKINVTSKINGKAGLYLKITWPVATKKTVGIYGCEITGYDQVDSFVSVHTQPVKISQKILTVKDVRKLIESATSDFETVKRNLENETTQLKAYIKNELNEIKQQVQSEFIKVQINLSDAKRDMDLRFATKNELAVQISTVRNDTLSSISMDNQNDDRKHRDIYTAIQHLADKCSANYTAIIGAHTDLTNLINRKIDAIKANEIKRKNQVDSKLSTLTKDVQSIDSKYENKTDLLATKVGEKLNCTCSQTIPTTQTASTTTSSTTNQDNSSSWPHGLYGLVAPTTGCPDGRLADGTRLFLEKSADTQLIAVALHAKDLSSKYFAVTVQTTSGNEDLKYCMKTTSQSLYKRSWPQGSYCIASYKKSCPQQFENEVLTISAYQNSHLHVFPMHFCCRSDGSVTAAVQLPTAKPVSLFRHGDTCQAVAGMDVTDDSVQFEPINGTTIKTYYHVDPRHHDDKTAFSTIHVCHYQRSSNN